MSGGEIRGNAHRDRSAPFYELRGASRWFGQGGARVRAVDRVNLGVREGEFLVIAGPSGSGKTTLLQLLGGLDRPSEGEVLFEGRDLGAAGDGELAQLRLETVGFIFQQFNLVPTLTGEQNVEAALAPRGVPTRDRRARALEVLGSVGLGSRATHLPSELSGGEQQRVAIARALANRPRVLLADEPTGNLDRDTGSELVALLRGLNLEQRLTIVLVTHDPAIAASVPRTVRMEDGRLTAPEISAAEPT